MNKQGIIRVRDVMKTKFDIVDGMITVADALSTMKHVDTKSLIVNKRHDNDEYGMLLIADVAREVLAKDRQSTTSRIHRCHACYNGTPGDGYSLLRAPFQPFSFITGASG